MTEQELQTERLIFIAMTKALSEQGTFLTGTMRMQLKHDFNALIRLCDRLIGDFEKKLNENQIAYVESVTDIFHNINTEIRRQAKVIHESDSQVIKIKE